MSTQEDFDNVFAKVDRTAPAQGAAEGPTAYTRRLSSIAQRYIPKSDPLASIDFSALPGEAVDIYAQQVRDSMVKHLYSTVGMEPGQLRPVLERDANTGQTIRSFVGPTSFVRDPAYGHRPGRRVAKINGPPQQALFEDRKAKVAGWAV